MFFVKQMYVGWVGVMKQHECTSGVCVFNVESEERKRQLIKYVPTMAEKQELLDTLNKNLPHRKDYISFVERSINASKKG